MPRAFHDPFAFIFRELLILVMRGDRRDGLLDVHEAIIGRLRVAADPQQHRIAFQSDALGRR